jgi:geranylgeranyl diphosphate synthase, type I
MAFDNKAAFDSEFSSLAVRVNEDLQNFLKFSQYEFKGSFYSDIMLQRNAAMHENVARFVDGGGKRLRPAIYTWTAMACGYPKEDNLITPSLSPELLHNFTLVHDDVMDRDKERRGRPTVRARYHAMLPHVPEYSLAELSEEERAAIPGLESNAKLLVQERWRHADNQAINAGDFLVALSAVPIYHSELPDHTQYALWRELFRAMRMIAIGQSNDMFFTEDKRLLLEGKINIQDMLRMFDDKTGWLFAYCGRAGVVTADGRSYKDMLKDPFTARKLGVAEYLFKVPFNRRFQMYDDLIEFNIGGKKDKGDKNIGNDYREGKLTPLIALTLQKASPAKRKLVVKHLGDPTTSQEHIMRVIDVMHSTGAVGEIVDLCKQMGDTAKMMIDELDPVEPYRTYLRDLTEFVGDRPK